MNRSRILLVILLIPVLTYAGWEREVLDWSVIGVSGIGGFIIKEQEPYFQRPLIPGPGDKPFTEEQVPNSWLYAASAGMVGLAVLLPNQEGWMNSRTYSHLKGSLQSVGVSLLIKEFSKNIAGRPRPDYHDRLRRGIKVEKARKSWPSGHATHAFNVATYLGLYTWDEWRSSDPFALAAKSGITALLASGAAWVAYTRVADNRHYVGDVIAGSLLGAGCSLLCYSYQHWWSAPDDADNPADITVKSTPSITIPLVAVCF